VAPSWLAASEQFPAAQRIIDDRQLTDDVEVGACVSMTSVCVAASMISTNY
jgi:hypothetical protein